MNDATFCTIYKRYYDSLLSFANTHLSDYSLAEDLVQDTFLSFYETNFIDFFSTSKDIFSLLTNKLESLIAHEDFILPLPELDDEQIKDDKLSFLLFQSMKQTVLIKQQQLSLYQSLLSLKPKEKKILYLSIVQKKNAKEIGKLYSMSHCSVRKRIERIRQKLYNTYNTLVVFND